MSGAFTVNLANVPMADPGYDDWAGSFFVRGANGSFTPNGATVVWADLVNPVSGTMSLSRRSEVMYSSPTWSGFQFQSAWGEDDFWAVALQYAGEFSGFRVAGKIGYTDMSDPQFGCETEGGGVTVVGVDTFVNVANTDCQMWAMSGSIMHVPTGLYVSASYGELHDDLRQASLGAGFDDEDSNWYIQAGIENKWHSWGKTTLYGEYGEQENGTFDVDIHGKTISAWGLGVVQTVDAAAMDLYLAYRNFEAHTDIVTGPVDDIHLVGIGALIKF